LFYVTSPICGKTGGVEDRRDFNICNTNKPESTINYTVRNLKKFAVKMQLTSGRIQSRDTALVEPHKSNHIKYAHNMLGQHNTDATIRLCYVVFYA